jgi:hypothetical protein
MNGVPSSQVMAAVLLLGLASCANPVNQKHARQYHEWGLQAERAGNYVLAERNYERALVNARLGRSPDSGLSMVMYNLGRTKGYLCKYDESEKLLLEALLLEEKASGVDSALTVMRLFELARLQYDRGLYSASLPYFERAVPAVTRLGAETSDPIGFSEVLEEYATALARSGEASRAEALRVQAGSLRARHPGKMARAMQVRYNQRCPSPAAETSRQEDREEDALLRVTRDHMEAMSGGPSNIEIVEVNWGDPRSRAFSRDEKRTTPGLVMVGIKATAYAGWTFRGHQYKQVFLCTTFNAQANQVYTFAAAGPDRSWAVKISGDGQLGAKDTPASIAIVPYAGQTYPCRWTGGE